jgi:hypothetical protein
MENEHTPGPWFAEPQEAIDRTGIVIVAPGTGRIVATITPADRCQADAMDWANARLIAAAPDFLNMLREFIEDTETVGLEHITADWPDLIETHKHAKVAIGKTSHWEDDPEFPAEDWKYEVANEDTRLGYREWVEHQRHIKQEEL